MDTFDPQTQMVVDLYDYKEIKNAVEVDLNTKTVRLVAGGVSQHKTFSSGIRIVRRGR